MSTPTPVPPKASQIADQYFLEHRAKLLDIAAFLDRFDRAAKSEGVAGSATTIDVRIRALCAALELLRDGKPERTRRALELWSDHTIEPIEKAGMKGAIGAVPLPHIAPPR